MRVTSHGTTQSTLLAQSQLQADGQTSDRSINCPHTVHFSCSAGSLGVQSFCAVQYVFQTLDNQVTYVMDV